jgi:hypothetical protein
LSRAFGRPVVDDVDNYDNLIDSRSAVSRDEPYTWVGHCQVSAVEKTKTDCNITMVLIPKTDGCQFPKQLLTEQRPESKPKLPKALDKVKLAGLKKVQAE